MKKGVLALVCAVALTCGLGGCATSNEQQPAGVGEPQAAAPSEAAKDEAPGSETPNEAEAPETTEPPENSKAVKPMKTRTIEVRANGETATFELNESLAADALLTQLPLTIEVEDFGTNEKIFYPPEPLDTAGVPHAQGGAGTLAYYAPWGNVVMFYGSYSPNDGLYELGQAVSGVDAIGTFAGTIEVTTAE